MAEPIDSHIEGFTHAAIFVPPISAGGLLRIAGTVTVEGEPEQRRVVLMKRDQHAVIASQRSAADGSFEFLYLRAGRYLVLGIDTAQQFDAVASDMIEPVE